MLKRLALVDMDAAARLHRIAFDQAMPWLVGLHTPDEDRGFYRNHVFARCRLWGRFDGDVLSGIIAFCNGWIEQLYVRPDAQGRGVGTELLDVAKGVFEHLQLWTFQRNERSRRFNESRGFEPVEKTDGARNEEKEPDARYVWTRSDR